MRLRAWNFETRHPADVSGLAALLASGALDPRDVLCVLGKTEGNGGRNDFTRDLAMGAYEQLLGPLLGCAPGEVQDRVIFSFSGGTEGVVTPHAVVFAREGDPLDARQADKRLAATVGATRAFEPWEIGRMPQVLETARAVRALVAGLKVDGPGDVHLVQMKGAIPTVTEAARREAEARGLSLRCDMVFSRAASALGVALALGEVSEDALSDAVICRDWSLFSGVASCSAKPGLGRTELLVFGNSAYATGELKIAHGVLDDILDVAGVEAVMRRAGVDPARVRHDPDERAKIVGIFAKSEADPRGAVRGRRNTMTVDDDISDTRYSRCVLASVLAATTGETRVYVSTRAEHHGPLGGGPLAMVVRAEGASR
ncbi:MAG: ring-opening amidohydrolase [Myxococcales bacterium]|nr:ring-opening amidohydrolase [Myxococcales bacterium]